MVLRGAGRGSAGGQQAGRQSGFPEAPAEVLSIAFQSRGPSLACALLLSALCPQPSALGEQLSALPAHVSSLSALGKRY